MISVTDPEPFITEWALDTRGEWSGDNETSEEWARQYLVKYSKLNGPNGLPFVSQGTSLASAVLHMCALSDLQFRGAVSEELGSALVQRASDDPDCDLLARSLVGRAATEGWQLPASIHALARFYVAGEQHPGKRGVRYSTIRSRNLVGAEVLAVLTRGFGLPAARNVATSRKSSACDVLARAAQGQFGFNFTYDAAASVWSERVVLWLEFMALVQLEILRSRNADLSAAFCLPLLAELEEAGVGVQGRKKRN